VRSLFLFVLIKLRHCGHLALSCSLKLRAKLVTRHSLDRAKGELLVLLYIFLFGQRFFFSTTRGPIYAKVCMRAYSGSGCVFSPFGVSVPWERKKGSMKFSLLWESMGNFCILVVFERYLRNTCTDPHYISSV